METGEVLTDRSINITGAQAGDLFNNSLYKIAKYAD